MPAYKVVGRPHRRATMVNQVAVAPDGTRIEIKQAGPLETFRVGEIIEDIRRHELEAFPDRFMPATEDELKAWKAQQAEGPVIMRAPGMDEQQAKEYADLEKQLAELQAKKDALLSQARVPVPTVIEIDKEDPTKVAGMRPVEEQGDVSTTHESPAGRGPRSPGGTARAPEPPEKK